MPQHQVIFQRNLSKLTSREYKQVMKGIGVSIEAVHYNSEGPTSVAPDGRSVGEPCREDPVSSA